MQSYFYQLADRLFGSLAADKVLLLALHGESSEFVRLNGMKIRQAGSVKQNSLTLTLIHSGKQSVASVELQNELEEDVAACKHLLTQLEQQLSFLPADPYLNYATDVCSSESVIRHELPSSREALDQVFATANGLDVAGIWASGDQHYGFANSLGQRNWHSQNSFNFDWSIYHEEDKAVKCAYAGFDWRQATLEEKFNHAGAELTALKRPSKTLTPGQYRVYLSPTANRELLDMISWGGFGLKSHKAQHTPLLKMVSEDWRLHPRFTLKENCKAGLTPAFTHHGFVKPDCISLIDQGKYDSCLVNPRSAKEFNSQVNCDHEHPESLQLDPGGIEDDHILSTLDTGIYIGNLWYCNFSDHNHCRITGMTRFACFWVENGEITNPVDVMRFDDSIYNMYGKNLVGLTRGRETIFDSNSYEHRSATSYQIPGAIIDDFTLTL